MSFVFSVETANVKIFLQIRQLLLETEPYNETFWNLVRTLIYPTSLYDGIRLVMSLEHTRQGQLFIAQLVGCQLRASGPRMIVYQHCTSCRSIIIWKIMIYLYSKRQIEPLDYNQCSNVTG